MINPHPLTPAGLITKLQQEAKDMEKQIGEISKPMIEYSPDNLKNAEAAIEKMKVIAFHLSRRNYDILEYLEVLKNKLE